LLVIILGYMINMLEASELTVVHPSYLSK